jgi:hypothetical protein
VWSDVDDEILGGDLTAGLAYVTPAAGAVVTAVAPIGLRDREAGTVGFTTSLGFGRKLDRIKQNPQVALAYHAREHGFATAPRFVLVQGTARYDAHPDQTVLEERVRPASVRFLGPPRTGVFWDHWLKAYYADRVLVTVAVERVISWPDLACEGKPTVSGKPLPSGDPPPQPAPTNGTSPRVDVGRAARRIRSLTHVLLAHVGGDGFPEIVPVAVQDDDMSGLQLSGPLPVGARRAGLLAHRYQPKLIGLETHQYTGWLENGVYAPHTEKGFRAPSNKTLLLLVNGFMARRGLARARAVGRT